MTQTILNIYMILIALLDNEQRIQPILLDTLWLSRSCFINHRFPLLRLPPPLTLLHLSLKTRPRQCVPQ